MAKRRMTDAEKARREMIRAKSARDEKDMKSRGCFIPLQGQIGKVVTNKGFGK